MSNNPCDPGHSPESPPAVQPPKSSGNVDGLRSRVILDPDDRQVLTFIRYVDARTALARGLKEYFEQGAIDWINGRRLAFANVLQTWAEPETPAQFPSLVILGSAEAAYEESGARRSSEITKVEDGTNRYVRFSSELTQTFDLQIWTSDPTARSGLVALIEDMLEPTDFMAGLRLELPYYFGVRASYEKIGLSYVDDESDAQRRWKLAVIHLHGTICQIVPIGNLGLLTIEQDTTVTDGALT